MVCVFVERNRGKQRVNLVDELLGFFLVLQNGDQIALDDLQQCSHRRRINSIMHSIPRSYFNVSAATFKRQFSSWWRRRSSSNR